MDTTPEMKKLHQLYAKTREEEGRKVMNYEHFENMLVFFPCLLVAASDGVVDQEEWVYIQYLSRFMADPFKSALSEPQFIKLKQDYYRELEFLLDHLQEWKDAFLHALQEYLEEYVEMKDAVLDALYLFAEASEGTSSVEQDTIDELIELLGLDDDDE